MYTYNLWIVDKWIIHLFRYSLPVLPNVYEWLCILRVLWMAANLTEWEWELLLGERLPSLAQGTRHKVKNDTNCWPFDRMVFHTCDFSTEHFSFEFAFHFMRGEKNHKNYCMFNVHYLFYLNRNFISRSILMGFFFIGSTCTVSVMRKGFVALRELLFSVICFRMIWFIAHRVPKYSLGGVCLLFLFRFTCDFFFQLWKDQIDWIWNLDFNEKMIIFFRIHQK